MLRRSVFPVLAAGLLSDSSGASATPEHGAKSLDRFVGSGGTALLVDVRTRRLIAIGRPDSAARSLSPPGSTLKPFVLAALIESGRLQSSASFPCPTRLRIAGRALDCSHPKLAVPVQIDTALAYSCNCFVAHVAENFPPGALARELTGLGFTSRAGIAGDDEAAGRVAFASTLDAQRLQALGENGILVTPAELAIAYCRLVVRIDHPEMRPIRAGLEEAVEFGTAQNAGVPGVKVAGKTGSVLTPGGEPMAWFAGFLPSTAPEVVITVMLPGRSGGGDAAPLARDILMAYRSGSL